MPDCHVGKGCTIGFTSTLPINGEIIPNIVVSTKTLDESPMAYKSGQEIEELIKDTCLIVDHLVPKYNFKAE